MMPLTEQSFTSERHRSLFHAESPNMSDRHSDKPLTESERGKTGRLEAEAEPLYSQISDEEFETLADRMAELLEYVVPDKLPLSDYAVSRETLYEEHIWP